MAFRLTAPPLVSVDPESSDEWYTPAWLLRCLPSMDLDPCSDPSRTTPCTRHIVAADGGDGLAARWTGSVWMNPPYSDLSTWCSKAHAETQRGHAACVVGLIPFRPEGFWTVSVWKAHTIGHLTKRIRFEHPRGSPAASSGRFPSALVLWGSAAPTMQAHIDAALTAQRRSVTWIKRDRCSTGSP